MDPTIERVFLPPSSHSTTVTRFQLPVGSGTLLGRTLSLEIALENERATNWWVPRAGGYALIDRIQILRNGEELSFLNYVGAYAALKAGVYDAEESERLEAKTGGALLADVPDLGVQGDVAGVACANHIVSYTAAIEDLPVSQKGRPLLPLHVILDLFHANSLIDLGDDRWEIIITWLSVGGVQPCQTIAGGTAAAIMRPSANCRLIYSVASRMGQTKAPGKAPGRIATELRPWMEVRTTNAVVASNVSPPSLVDGAADSQSIPIRFSNVKASGLFMAFLDTTAGTTFNSLNVAHGICYSRPISTSTYNLNVVVNGNAIYPRAITQDSERLMELCVASNILAGGTGGPGTSFGIPLGGGAKNIYTWTRGHSAIGAGRMCYYGFRLTEDGQPIQLNSEGIYLQLQRNALVGGATPALTCIAFLLGPKSM